MKQHQQKESLADNERQVITASWHISTVLLTGSLPYYASAYAITTPIIYNFCEDMGIYVKSMICGTSEITRFETLWREM